MTTTAEINLVDKEHNQRGRGEGVKEQKAVVFVREGILFVD
jgi:hypothetical protein